MKNNTLVKSLAALAVGGLTVKAVQILKLKKMEKEHEEVIEDAKDEK